MLETFYILLSLVMLTILLGGYYQALRNYYPANAAVGKKMLPLIILLVAWGGYTFWLSKSEILYDLSLPPRFPLLVFFPLIIIYTVFYIKNKNNPFIQSIPLKWTTYFQSFRILVELLLLFTFYKGIIPWEATFEGYNYDVLMGVSAPLVAYFLIHKGANKKLLYAWNILGILMVLFVGFIIGTSFYQPQIWGSETPIVKTAFLTMPYFLIPCFLAPLAIFIHVVSLCQLRKNTP